MLTVPEAAKRIGRNPETIRRWIREGKLSTKKIGTRHLIDEEDLDSVANVHYLPLPGSWTHTSTGEPMPDWLALLKQSRISH